MLSKQLSIFLPNRKGSLATVTDLMTKNNIEIHAIVAFDTTEFGILRVIADDTERAIEVFKNEGMVAKITDVLVFEPGENQESLSDFFKALQAEDVSVEYLYTGFMQEKGLPYMVMHVNKPDVAMRILNDKNLRIIRC